jgi:hypothetical protein
MVYQWDEKRAKRAQMIRITAALLLTVTFVGVPLWAVHALGL